MRQTSKAEWEDEAERLERLGQEALRQIVCAKPAEYYFKMARIARSAARRAV